MPFWDSFFIPLPLIFFTAFKNHFFVPSANIFQTILLIFWHHLLQIFSQFYSFLPKKVIPFRLLSRLPLCHPHSPKKVQHLSSILKFITFVFTKDSLKFLSQLAYQKQYWHENGTNHDLCRRVTECFRSLWLQELGNHVIDRFSHMYITILD